MVSCDGAVPLLRFPGQHRRLKRAEQLRSAPVDCRSLLAILATTGDTLRIDASTACSPYFEPEPKVSGLTGFLHGPSTGAVREAYRRAGFELGPATHELPDHLAHELEFMGRLLERGDGDHARVFFSEHLGRWALRCLADVKQQAHLAFYRPVADSLTVFLRREQGRLTAQLPGYGMG